MARGFRTARGGERKRADAGAKPGTDEKIITTAANAGGIRDTARVLGVSTDKVMDTLKTEALISPVNQRYINEHSNMEQVQCDIVPFYVGAMGCLIHRAHTILQFPHVSAMN